MIAVLVARSETGPAPFYDGPGFVPYTVRALTNKPSHRRVFLKNRFKVGDHVTWNSEAGYVSGKIIRVHIEDVDYKGHMQRASKDEPQYEIPSDKTDHIAMHKGAALNKLK